MELENPGGGGNGVTGVAAAVRPDHEISSARQRIRQLAFAFISPLAAHDDRCRHVSLVLPGYRAKAPFVETP
jgi:hypothetical protein